MLIRLLPPVPHPTILYGLTFPHVLSLQDLGPGATMPAAWSSQLQILTSALLLEPPSSIHMLDRGVGLVARVDEVTMDVPRKEFVLRFVDGRVINIPMNSDCVRMLLGVVVDVKGCSESESQRGSMEGSVCPGSTFGSAEDFPSGGSPAKSTKSGKHKRQRSLLFSLISSLVPKSLSSLHRPPSSAPPPAPLPPFPVSSRVSSPVSPQQSTLVPEHPDHLRRRARATLADVWRRHVISAVAPQHLPAAGYVEWILIVMASKVRAEIESLEAANSHSARAGGNRHRRTQSDGRKALDFGDRIDDCGPEQWRCRAPSPFPGMFNSEDIDRVVYPRREQADEWGVRFLHHSNSIDEADVFAVEYSGHNDSLLGEHFTVGDDWDDTERLTFELTRLGHHSVPGFDDRLSGLGYLHPGDFRLDYSDDDGSGLADTAFDVSRCPLTPTDVNDDEQSDDSQISLRTPEDGEDLPLALPARIPQGTTRDETCSASRPPSVSRVGSSRPRSRNASAQYSNAPSPPAQALPSSIAHHSDYRNSQADELFASHLEMLDRICAALELVRSRARQEGWRIVRATSIGTSNEWMDAETERSLEIKAKRRAWSSGIKISAPYSTPRAALRVWDGSSLTSRPPMRPPGLASSKGISQVHGPIVPTGLSLGIPVRSSPLALYSWAADDGRPTRSKYGILNSGHCMETIKGKRTSRVTFADNITKLFPVCEDDGEDLFEPVQVNAVGFPQVVPVSVTAEEPGCSLIEGPAGREDDPFYFCPSRPRTRTQSMHMISPAPSASSSPVIPIFRPSTPPPSYQAVVRGDVSVAGNNEEGPLDASALLLQPLSSLSISSPQPASREPPLVSNPPLVPRPRAVSLPTPRFYPNMHKARRTSFHHKDEHCEDLSQAYASPPPEGPLVVSATPAPHEQYPRYAHVYSPISASKRSMNATILERTGKEVVFEQAGSEFTVGIEVALGRAEEGRVVW
ncbi:hypothetical protein L210DRAFT_3639122 [Boletus edulis BED1]|uniref:Uncharacterized protein n=1 Tax=Boletus edulis BED1 TaxID=1328754 RepID=A0AAD4C9F9_BOLED|nr:hypothetical protein L210DRAFT_3639122 [Boletus edulis BED1]